MLSPWSLLNIEECSDLSLPENCILLNALQTAPSTASLSSLSASEEALSRSNLPLLLVFQESLEYDLWLYSLVDGMEITHHVPKKNMSTLITRSNRNGTPSEQAPAPTPGLTKAVSSSLVGMMSIFKSSSKSGLTKDPAFILFEGVLQMKRLNRMTQLYTWRNRFIVVKKGAGGLDSFLKPFFPLI